MLAPIDEVGADQLCESNMGDAAAQAPLLGEDGVSLEHSLMPTAPADSGSILNLLDDGGNVRTLEDIEADAIRFALTHYRGQMSEVARRLCIGRSTLYRKLEVLHGAMANEPAAELRGGDTHDKNDVIYEEKRARILTGR